MVTMIMAIGFSIEYCAHVTYAFVSSTNQLSPQERCVEALEKLAWPGTKYFHSSAYIGGAGWRPRSRDGHRGHLTSKITKLNKATFSRQQLNLNWSFTFLLFSVLYGSMSTILGVAVLAFIDSYMVLVFFKTIFLVIVIGALHALVLLPIILTITAPIADRIYQQCSTTVGPINDDRPKNEKSGPFRIVIGVSS